MHKFRQSLMITLALCLAACSKSPMQWLASDQRVEHLTTAFWAKEFEGKTKLWQDAMNYCQKHTEKINCGPVVEVSLLLNNNTELAKPGSGHEIREPKY
jgi:hypothetical protein